MGDEDTIERRWAKPLIPLAIEQDRRRAKLNPVLDVWEEVLDLTFSQEDVERLRTGRACLNCYEPFESPYPALCGLCGYRVKELQDKDFALEYDGAKHIGPSTSMQEELDRLDEDTKPRMWHKPGSSILLPRGVEL